MLHLAVSRFAVRKNTHLLDFASDHALLEFYTNHDHHPLLLFHSNPHQRIAHWHDHERFDELSTQDARSGCQLRRRSHPDEYRVKNIFFI